MAKHPWFKAWAKDILGDKDFATISLAGKGFWLNLICLMHLSPRKGYLLQENGTPYSMETLSRLSGVSPDEAAHLYQCLISSGIFSVSETDPKVPFSRRMVREARITDVRSQAGTKGGFATAKSQQKSSKHPSKHPSKPLEYVISNSSIAENENPSEEKLLTQREGVQGEGGFAAAKSQQNRPTLEEVRAYCRERGNTVDPEAWIDHYASNGWKVGRATMKDWKACVRQWERNSFGARKPEKDFMDIACGGGDG